VRLVAGAGTVFKAGRHDEQVALPQLDGAVAELDLELALEHVEEIVGVRVAVPDELALDLHRLDLVGVHRREPIVRERSRTSHRGRLRIRRPIFREPAPRRQAGRPRRRDPAARAASWASEPPPSVVRVLRRLLSCASTLTERRWADRES
jgi:hypothetical protein